MFSRIMVPVDLTHLEQLDKALTLSEDLARTYSAEIVYVSVTAETPTKIAHNPKEFAAKLEEFAASRPGTSSTKSYASHDPTIDMDKTLLNAIDDTGADLVVMASHKPGIADFFWGSHGGNIASHTGVSVFIVR